MYQNPASKTVKGLNIAIIILSALNLVAVLFLSALLGAAGLFLGMSSTPLLMSADEASQSVLEDSKADTLGEDDFEGVDSLDGKELDSHHESQRGTNHDSSLSDELMYDIFGDSVLVSAAFIMVLIAVMLIFGFVSSVLALIASILALRNNAKPEKLKGAFIWSIIAAVASGISGSIVTLILLIISCVYINKVRKGQIAPQPTANTSGPVPPAHF